MPGRLTPQIARALGIDVESGVLVLEVLDGGPAADAEMQPGDVIVEFNGAEVASIEEFLGELRGVEPGEAVSTTVVRQGEQRRLSIEIGRLEQ